MAVNIIQRGNIPGLSFLLVEQHNKFTYFTFVWYGLRKLFLKTISTEIKQFQLMPVCKIRLTAQLQGIALCQHC